MFLDPFFLGPFNIGNVFFEGIYTSCCLTSGWREKLGERSFGAVNDLEKLGTTKDTSNATVAEELTNIAAGR